VAFYAVLWHVLLIMVKSNRQLSTSRARWVGLGRVQSFMLILCRVRLGQENFSHAQL